MLTQTAEYALRAVVWLAERPERSQTVQEIARGTSVPSMYLAKVMQMLVRAGTVRGQRGRTGGFALIKPPSELSVLEVVNAVEPIRRIRECPLGLAQHGTHLCPLHRKLDNAAAALEQDFRNTCLSELIEVPITQNGSASHAS